MHWSEDSSAEAMLIVYVNMKISRHRLADYVKKLHQKACHMCSMIIFLHSTNEIIDSWHCRWRCRRQISNSLIFDAEGTWNLLKTLNRKKGNGPDNINFPLDLLKRLHLNFRKYYVSCLINPTVQVNFHQISVTLTWCQYLRKAPNKILVNTGQYHLL